MTHRDPHLQALAQLVHEVQRLHMQQTAQRSAYVVLARNLACQGLLGLTALASELELMGQSQTDADWQSAHAELADVLVRTQQRASTRSQDLLLAR